jgi:hypothetical protein
MCIEKVQAWSHAGKLFPTEEDALNAALKDLAASIQKDHSHELHVGLLKNSDALLRVLSRLVEIEDAKPKAAEPMAVYEDAA